MVKRFLAVLIVLFVLIPVAGLRPLPPALLTQWLTLMVIRMPIW